MIKAARLSKIKEIMMERGHVDVTALSSALNVSEVTIRSDLEQLEQESFIHRIHGGAVLNEDNIHRLSDSPLFNQSKIEYVNEKEYVAGIAADMVDTGNWVFIGQGTTCYYVACALSQKDNVRVVTNNLLAASAFYNNSSARVMFTGGMLNTGSLYLEGDLFFQTIENLHFSEAFFGAGGISIENGITVNGSGEIAIINKIRNLADHLIIVSDYSKFGKTSFMRMGYIDYVDTIITNENIPEEYKEYCYNHNIRLFTSYRLPHSSQAGS